MGKRRKARELITQFLYTIDIAGKEDISSLVGVFLRENNASREVEEYFNRLMDIFIKNQIAIDELIMKYTTNWDITRIAVVDRNILRSAICELLYMNDIPPIVSINEAVDIAKKYGTKESGKFVNGILDKIRIEKDKKP